LGMILAGVYCHDYSPDQAGTCVRLWNSGPDPADLSGLILEWDGARLAFPAGPPLLPEASAYVAWNADGFRRLFARSPDYRVTRPGDAPRLVARRGRRPRALRPEGGAVRLLTPGAIVLDACVWGTGPAAAEVDGWLGPALPPPAAPGIAYQRAIREESLSASSPGRFSTGPGAAAWRQGADWLPRRLVRAGQGELTYPSFTAPGALAFACPDAAFTAISRFVDAAVQTLDINIYLFTHARLGDRVLEALQRGVAVRLLVEGEPYGGMPPSSRDNVRRLQEAGVQVRMLHGDANGFRRYRYDHAKYAVADGRRCLVMSDNWTNTSVPVTPMTGNRGWGIITESDGLAAHLTGIFEGDWNPASPDSTAFDADAVLLVEGPPPPPDGAQRALPDPLPCWEIAGPVGIAPCAAPEHALLETRGVCGLMRSATRTLDVQQNSLHLYWGGFGPEGSLETTPSLFLAEVVAAARRGVRVRVLLDGAYIDGNDPRDNTHTKAWLAALAAAEQLPLEARILDRGATGMAVHNKGLIVDGEKVLVSSINWSENSPLENRELGLIVESPAAAGYYLQVFERDWAGGR